MFSFIRKFFENRRQKAAERDRLCQELYERVTRTLLNYIDVNKGDKDALHKWLADNSALLVELSDVGRFKKSSYYNRLCHQKRSFDEFWAEANAMTQSLRAKEKQKRADDEYVAKRLNLWVSEQIKRKSKTAVSKALNRKLGKLSAQSDDSFAENEDCPCCGKNGKKKILYATEGEALIVAEHRSQMIKWPLRVYPCPYGRGYHITSNVN